jgi:hypothetical protein
MVKFIFLFVPLFVFLTNCASKRDMESDKQLLLQLDEQARQFHFAKNAKAMASGFTDNFISINRGHISQPSYQDRYNQFSRYFGSVDFIKWDNVTPPIIRFSDDASVAYVTIDKLVVLKSQDAPGNTLDTTYFAWLSVFKKRDGQWLLDCIASTNK